MLVIDPESFRCRTFARAAYMPPLQAVLGWFVGAAYMRPAGVRKAGVHDLCRGPGMPGPYRCIFLYRFASFPATSPDRPLMTSTSTSRTTAVP